MRLSRARSGPFVERIYLKDDEIESMATNELRGVGLLPTEPSPIRVDRFIEKRFAIVPRFEELPPSLLGFTRFGPAGPTEVVVARALSEEGSRAAERRISSTLAHEVGHMLVHGELFRLQRRSDSKALFEDDIDFGRRTVLCRTSTDDSAGLRSQSPSYDGRWWEFQANKFIGALLLPRVLIREALGSFLVSRGQLGIAILPRDRRGGAVQRLADAFDVNPVVARIRLETMFPAADEQQLTL